MAMEYTVIRSDRKTVAIQITPQGEVLVRCPRKMSRWQIRKFVQSKMEWIGKSLQKCGDGTDVLTAEQIRSLADRALTVIPERVAHFAPLVGVSYGRITIRNQRSRWGSCSAQGNLNFNCLLMLVPPEVLDYVVVHELCHRKEMNHSAAFWAQVEAVLPDYKERRKWLKDNGTALIARIP